MSKEWRALYWSGAFGEPHWIVSRRKLTDGELESLRKEKVSYDYLDTLGICGDGYMFLGALTVPGASKDDLKDITADLNKGKKTLADLFNLEEVE